MSCVDASFLKHRLRSVLKSFRSVEKGPPCFGVSIAIMDAQTKAFLLSYAYVASTYEGMAIRAACNGCNGSGGEHDVCTIEDDEEALVTYIDDLFLITNDEEVVAMYGAVAEHVGFTVPMALQLFATQDPFIRIQEDNVWKAAIKLLLLALF